MTTETELKTMTSKEFKQKYGVDFFKLITDEVKKEYRHYQSEKSLMYNRSSEWEIYNKYAHFVRKTTDNLYWYRLIVDHESFIRVYEISIINDEEAFYNEMMVQNLLHLDNTIHMTLAGYSVKMEHDAPYIHPLQESAIFTYNKYSKYLRLRPNFWVDCNDSSNEDLLDRPF